MTICTLYRWVETAVKMKCPGACSPFALFPIEIQPAGVLSCNVSQNGPALVRESQERVSPGDYGIYETDGSRPDGYYHFQHEQSFALEQMLIEKQYTELAATTVIPPALRNQVLERDRGCTLTGVGPESATLVVTWIFPPFLGYLLSDDQFLVYKYYSDPRSCNLGEFLVVKNGLTMTEGLAELFWENIFGIDVDDNYRIVLFDKRDCLNGPLKSHLIPSDDGMDRFLRLHFERCLSVSAFGGDVREDYEEGEINQFMDELGVFDEDGIDSTHPGWQTPLGREVHAWLLRRRLLDIEEVDE